jgi:hypothetical protein
MDRLRIVILPSVSARAYDFGTVSNSLQIIPESNGVTDGDPLSSSSAWQFCNGCKVAEAENR